MDRFFGVTFSFTAHANDIFAPRDFEIGLDKLLNAARVIVTETDYAEKFLQGRFPNCADRIHRIYNALNLAEFRRADFSSAPPLIVAVGRLIDKKGFADLIQACRLLMERGISFRCQIFGEGPLEKKLHEQIVELDLQSYVELAGPKPQHERNGFCSAERDRFRGRHGQSAHCHHGGDGDWLAGHFNCDRRNSGNGNR